MTLVGGCFSLVLLVWVVLDHIRQLRPKITDVQDAITEALEALPKAIDHAPELAALTKRVSTLEAGAGLKRLSG